MQNRQTCRQFFEPLYVHDGKMPLRKKGQGCTIHILDFIVEHTGQLTLSTAQCKDNMQLPVAEWLEFVNVCEIIYSGKNHDGFWMNEKLVVQVSFGHNQIFWNPYLMALCTGQTCDSDCWVNVSEYNCQVCFWSVISSQSFCKECPKYKRDEC